MNLNLEGKVGIVTGSARGIGRAIALALAGEGVKVVIDDIDLEAAKLVEEQAIKSGGEAMAIRADVTKPDEVSQMVRTTLNRFNKIDILVNNVGILYVEGKPVAYELFTNSTEDDWRAILDVTLSGVLNCSKAVLEAMLKQKSGNIINIASDVPKGPQRNCISIYSAGKGGIISFTKNLAFELGPSGIRVNCVSPGKIRTTRMEMIETEAEKRPEVIKFVEVTNELLKRQPISRVGNPQDIANMVIFLASDVSSYITGQTFHVNGGRFMA